MQRHRRFAIWVAVACALSATACAATDSPRGEAAAGTQQGSIHSPDFSRALGQAFRKTGAPGLAAAVVQDGVVVWHGEAGVADKATARPVASDTLFSLASVTKSYVAAMTIALASEGQIDLDTSVAEYLPRWVPGAKWVSLRQLLGMTAGYRDVEADGGWVSRAWKDPNFPWDRVTMTKLLYRLKAPHFRPGSRYRYSNANYLLLGLALPKLSGEAIEESFQRIIRAPLDLEGTSFAVDPSVTGRLSHGYEARRGRVVDTFTGARLGYPTDIWGTVWTDGGIEATASDVARFNDALYGGRLLDPDELDQMTTLGPGDQFGLGMYDSTVHGHTWQGMDGYYGGFTSLAATDVRRHVTIVVLANGTAGRGSEDASDAWTRLVYAYDAANRG